MHPTKLPLRLAAGWTSAILAATALVFVPMAYLPSFDVPKLAFLLLAATLLAGWTWARRARHARDDVVADPILAVPLLMALVAACGAILAWPGGSLVGPVTAFACVAVARMVAQAEDPRRAVRWIARGAAVSAAVAAAYGCCQSTGYDFTPWAARREPVATFGNTSFAAEFQAAALPMSLLLALHRESRRGDRLLGGLGAVLAAVHLALATSRVDYVAAVAGLGVGACLVLHARGRSRVAAGIAIGGVVAGLALGAAFVTAARADEPTWLGRSDTLAVRADVWKSTARMIADAPVRVAGASFLDKYPAWRSPDEYRTSLGRRVETPHDDYLELAVALGVPGLVAALGVMIAMTRRVVSLAREHGLECAAIGATLTAIGVSALASSPLSHPSTALLTACAAGLLVGLAPRPWRAWSVPARTLDVAVLGGLALAFVAGPAWNAMRSDGFLALGREELAHGNATRALLLLDISASADSQAFDARYELGSVLRSAGRGNEAIAALESAAALRPGDFECRVNLAYALRDVGRRDEATRLVDESLTRCPWHPLLLAAKAIFALEDGHFDEARNLAHRAAAGLPTEPRLAALAAEADLAVPATRPGDAPDTIHIDAVFAYEPCLDALVALFVAGETDELRRSTRSMLGRDRGLLGPLVTRARRLVATRPDQASALVLAASSAVADDAGFLDDASRVLRDAGRPEESTILLGRSLGVLAAEAFARGENGRALKFAEQAAERAPSPAHYLLAARAATRLGERDAAIESIGAAVASGPVDPLSIRGDPVLGGLLPNRRLEEVLDRAARRSGENRQKAVTR